MIVRDVAISADGTQVVAGSEDGFVYGFHLPATTTVVVNEDVSHSGVDDLAHVVEQRVKDLLDHLEQDLKLLKSYEDELRYEDDPKRKTKYHREIENLKKSLVGYQQQYTELRIRAGNNLPLSALDDISGYLDEFTSITDRFDE